MILMWTDNLSVGIKYFDEDHKRIVRMINELHDAILRVDASGQIAEDEIEIALHRLENYFQYHCIQEEVFMLKIAYPEIEVHKQLHRAFFEKVSAISQAFRGSRSPMHANELMQFIYEWLTDHIHITDKKYADYFATCKISPDFFQYLKSTNADRNRLLNGAVPVKSQPD
jgi:hemerythrin